VAEGLRCCLLSLLAARVAAHGAIITPRSRNSVDYLVGVNVPKDWPGDRDCTNITGGACNNGQAPFWYSQGCFIGCAECDHLSGRRQIDLCESGKTRTIDPKYRTVNRNATAGSEQDIYKHNPWAAPGTAPVADACGLAGGTPWPQEVSEAGDYTTTKYAHHGMNGTKLAPLNSTSVKWKIGGVAEVTWQLENHHGGGYQYRLCSADEPLTEACFQRTPLDFVTDEQGIVFKGQSHSWVPVEGTFIAEGTHPPGSMWAMIPMPTTALGPRCIAGPNDTASTPNACEPWEKGLVEGACKPCPGTAGSDCSRCDNNWHGQTSFSAPCDGCEGGSHLRAIRDVVKIPKTLKPGKYVLGWRWDCEATAQVWSNCADIELV